MKLLSVGAGIEQMPFIIKAKEAGHTIYALDINTESPGFAFSDFCEPIDISNKEKVALYFEKNGLDGLVPVPLGRTLTTVGYLNTKFNLPGISYDASVYCTDKDKYQTKLLKSNIPQPFQYTVEKSENLKEFVKTLPFPLIVKPQFGSGSRGVVTIKDINDLHLIDDHIKLLAKDEHSIIQEFLEGPEFGYDGIMENGRLTTALIREKVLTSFPYRQEIAYISPAELSPAEREEMRATVEKICLSLGIDNCLINADVIIRNKTPYVIELAGRPGGISIASSIIPYVTGINYISVGIDLNLSKKVVLPEIKQTPLIISYFPFEGTVIKMPESSINLEENNLVEYSPKFKKGDVLEKVKGAQQLVRRGIFSITGSSVKEAKKNWQNFLKEFVIKPITNAD